VPKYDFNWQLVYRMQDPSLNNPANPNPRKEVKWGPQTWEELMIGWFDYTLDAPGSPRSRGTEAVRLLSRSARS
jgi:hypothetical protein